MTDEKFLMWRAIFSIVHLDGVLDPSEKEWGEKKIETLKLSDTQRTQLQSDLTSAQDLLNIFSKMSVPKDKAFVLHMVRTIGHIDESYDENEKVAFQNLEKQIMKNIDLEQMTDTVEAMEKDFSFLTEDIETENLPLLYQGFDKLNKCFDYFMHVISKL